MEKEQIVSIAEKVKAAAIGFIGVCITSMGATYFEEQATYRIPRILLPVFEILGNVGLAVAMIILGVALIIYGYLKWKKFSQKTTLYLVIAVVVLALGIYLAFSQNIFKDKDERMTDDEKRNEQIDEIRNMEKPDFKDEKVEAHFSEFDELLKTYKENIQNQNTQGITDSENSFMEWSTQSAEFIQGMSTNEEKVELASYMAQLSIKWNDARTGK